jgi:Rps23 Pro-64 3,4-dihydroxylase Tpa1-like proline 4-hydroxylase|tara:strand:+ start:61 stop:618 length:558 start_codon:yes stop_codon:yes gene_type:complete
MDHTEAIVKLDNVINPDLIKNLIKFTKIKAVKYLSIRKATIDKSIRKVKGYSIVPDFFNSATDQAFWNYVKFEIQRVYPMYKAKFPYMLSSKINQIDFLRYTSGGKYEIHTDHFTTSTRALSIIINLNDNYQGGDLIFTDQNKKEIKRCKLGKGSIVFFPSNFMYPHSIEPITEGTRYSVVAWLQ